MSSSLALCGVVAQLKGYVLQPASLAPAISKRSSSFWKRSVEVGNRECGAVGWVVAAHFNGVARLSVRDLRFVAVTCGRRLVKALISHCTRSLGHEGERLLPGVMKIHQDGPL